MKSGDREQTRQGHERGPAGKNSCPPEADGQEEPPEREEPRGGRESDVQERVLVDCAERVGVRLGHDTQHEHVGPLDSKEERASDERNEESRCTEDARRRPLDEMQPETTEEKKQGRYARGGLA